MRPLRILLIEDNPSDVRLVKEAAKEASGPLEMTVAEDGVEAMDYLHRAVAGKTPWPELVLLDLNLPRKNGREVLAEVKSSPNLKQIPVIVMTSSRSDEDIADAYALNANSYITKPGNLREFVRVIRSIENFWFLTATLPEGFRASPKLFSVPPMTSGAPAPSEPAYAVE
jgi:chemotaxis family two-component system response regulator Rcp1